MGEILEGSKTMKKILLHDLSMMVKASFIYDLEKMYDFFNLSKDAFLEVYCQNTEYEYDCTKLVLEIIPVVNKYNRDILGIDFTYES